MRCYEFVMLTQWFVYLFHKGLDRAAWTAYQRSQEPVPSEDITGIPALIPNTASTVDGPVSSSSEQQKAPSQSEARSKDDLALIQNLLPPGVSAQRPMSVAVPWGTTAELGGVSQNPPSPVMYISPEGTYMSKIIPNAVLPPSVDVVEINRNRTRNSVRTVSKCSLASASPAPSRTSSRASSRASARRPTLSSESSSWSRSDSSETLVSDSSTISSSSTAQAPSSGQESVVEVKLVNTNPRPNGQIKVVEERGQTTGPFTRSLSVMKKSKKPPPPSRSYSLHKDKMKRRSKDLAEMDLSGVTPRSGKERATGGYSADESAVEESFSSGAASPPHTQQQAVREGAKSVYSSPLPIENGLKKNLSPSSGYSSHNGTPHTKGTNPPPAGDQMPVKSLGTDISPNHTKPAVLALKALFDIPKQPKVTAPPPPPPETWAHNQRTFVLLCGPGPANIKFASPPPKRLQAQLGKGEVLSAEIPSSPSAKQRQHTSTDTAEQDSPSMNKRPGPLPPNLNLMQELQKVQESPLMNRALVKQADAPICPPQSPPLPPPPPPVDMPLDCSLNTLDVTDLPPPPPLLSPVSNTSAKTCQGIPAGIPPPPQQPPPPPPQHPPPPPPLSATPPKKDTSPTPQVPTQPNIPKAPPLPVNFKAQVSLRKVPPPQKKDPPTTDDDSSMVVTQSILQKVRLRSIKSQPKPEQSATEIAPAEQTVQKPTVSQVPPPKPIRRSLLLAEPPPDVAALIADEPKALPDTTEQMPKNEGTPKNSQSETAVLNSQSEKPITSQISSTISGSQPEAADLKSVSESVSKPIALNQPEMNELPSQPEQSISDLKPEQSNTLSEQSVSQTVVGSGTESKSEEQSESKPAVVSAAFISEPEQSAETSPPEPPVVDPQLESAISKTEQPEQETSKMTLEPVVPKSEIKDPESKPEAKALAIAQTEPTPSTAKAESVILKSEPEQTSEAPQSELNETSSVLAPDASSDPESILSVAQADKTISISDAETKSTDEPESQAAESKPEVPLVISNPEPESVAPKSEVLSTTTELNPEPETTASTSEPVSTAAVSQSATAIATTTVSKSLPAITVSTSQPASTALKPKTNIPKSSTSPTLRSPPASMTPSMRLQEAIRQRAAARSASDGPAKRLSVHSPPTTPGGSPLKSPTSTASFIFSKSNKKVVVETPASPEVQSSLRQTLQTELAAVSTQSNQNDGLKKVPPPVASKPKGKVQNSRNGLPNPSTEEAVTTDVQTAGQGAQSEDTRSKRH